MVIRVRLISVRLRLGLGKDSLGLVRRHIGTSVRRHIGVFSVLGTTARGHSDMCSHQFSVLGSVLCGHNGMCSHQFSMLDSMLCGHNDMFSHQIFYARFSGMWAK